MGGLSIVAAHLAAIGSVFAYSGWVGERPPGDIGPVIGFLGGGLVIASVGAVDDVKGIGAKKKLLGQILAASIAWAAGARIEAFDIPYIGSFEFGPVASYILTVGWIAAFVNAINLIDGLDGLASGIVLFAAITNTIVAFVTGNILAAVLNAGLGGAVLGFLYFNFNPATVFLGDTGSMFLGYCLGAAALLTGRQKESTVVALLVPLVALGVPLTDTLFTMIRRFLEKRPIFSADRGHIHHRLLDLGLTHRRVVLFLYGGSVLTCVAALLAAFGKSWQVGAALALAILVLIAGARFAGYFRWRVQQPLEEVGSREANALRGALPSLLACGDAAPTQEFVGILEAALESAGFAAADLTIGDDVVWSWSDGDDCLADTVEYSYPGVHRHRACVVHFIVRSTHSERTPKLELLLDIVAEAVQARLCARSIKGAATQIADAPMAHSAVIRG